MGDSMNLTGIHLPPNPTARPALWMDAPNTDGILTTVVNTTDTDARPARWMVAPNTGGTHTTVMNTADTDARPALWMVAPNTDGTHTTVMHTADTTISTVIATVPAKRFSVRTGLIVGTAADVIMDDKGTGIIKKQLLRISQQLLFYIININF